MRELLFAAVFVAVLLTGTGCSPSPAPVPAPPAGKPSAAAQPTEVTLTEGGVAEIEQAALKTKKAVVLVEFWTMASEPPADLALVASRSGDGKARGETLKKSEVAWHGVRKAEYLGTMYHDYFLRVILVNVDGPGKRDEVLKFLKDQDARHVTNLAWKDDPAAAEKYGFTGKAPHQVVFGRDGKRVWATGDPLEATLDTLIFKELDK